MSTVPSPEVQAVVESLIKLDDVYAAIEKELRGKILAIRNEYQPKFDAVVADRSTELSKKSDAATISKATPALPNFWLDVLANSEEFRDDIEEYDEPILEYLESVEAADIDPNDEDKGFIVTFKFNENPFFTNGELKKIYTTARANEFTDQLEIVQIASDKIEWKAGKDVTVETVVKKKSGGGAKKKKAQSKQEPRPSFFRFFRDLDLENFPSEMGDVEDDEDDEGQDELERLQMFMEHDWERASTLKELIIPRAIRWYTGEAVMDEEDEDDENDDEDDEDDESEEESEQDTPKAGKKKLLGAPKPGQNPEECKQQ